MPWSNGYYYRKVWRNGTCHSEYIGNGYIAELAARLDKIEQQERQAEREAWQAITDEQDDLDDEIDAVSASIGDLVDAVLLATGHRQHKRQWRKRRE